MQTIDLTNVIAYVNDYIKSNGTKSITGAQMNHALGGDQAGTDDGIIKVLQQVIDSIDPVNISETTIAAALAARAEALDASGLTTGDQYALEIDPTTSTGVKWSKVTGGTGAVSSVNGKTGVVVLTGSDIAVSDSDSRKIGDVIPTGTLVTTTTYATTSDAGVVKVGDNITATDGVISVADASDSVKGVIQDCPAATSGQTDPVEYVRTRAVDGSVSWTVNSGGVTDVQINGSTIVSSNIANIPMASDSALGVVLTSKSYASTDQSVVSIDTSGKLNVAKATSSMPGVIDEAPTDTSADKQYVRKIASDGTASWVEASSAIDVSSVFGATPALPSGYTLATLQGKDLYAIVDSNRFHVTLKYDSTKSSGSQGLFYYTDVDWDGNVDIVKSIL